MSRGFVVKYGFFSKYLSKAEPVRNDGNNKIEFFVNFTIIACVCSFLEISSPSIVAHIKQ